MAIGYGYSFQAMKVVIFHQNICYNLIQQLNNTLNKYTYY